ncbi:hypothetical protein CDAR_260571 [Caerostris darwini]|uniref:Uncharacterized protein n=1 Tax=Caerostris darwini TaxID=1538125 RepID=A0AAV4NQI4_9ARAC|nr:hypothetical protein CDAR_260571 [Caerostris darwini]
MPKIKMISPLKREISLILCPEKSGPSGFIFEDKNEERGIYTPQKETEKRKKRPIPPKMDECDIQHSPVTSPPIQEVPNKTESDPLKELRDDFEIEMAAIKEEIQFSTEHIKKDMDKEHENILQRMDESSEMLISSLDEERSLRDEVLIHVLMDSFEKLFCTGDLKTRKIVDSSKVQQRFVGLRINDVRVLAKKKKK